MSFRRRQESWKNVVVVVVVGVGFIQEMDVFACVKIAYQTPEDTEWAHKPEGRIGVGADRQSCDVDGHLGGS